VRITEEFPVEAQVASAHAFREEDLDWLSEQLMAFVAEQFFGLSVHQGDLPLPVYHHHGVGCGFNRGPKGLVLWLIRHDPRPFGFSTSIYAAGTPPC
jgi:hypothetical protein